MKFGLRLTSLAAIVAFGMAGALSASPLSPGVQPANQATTKLEMRLAEKEAAVGLAEAALSGSAEKIYLHADAIVTNADVVQARVVPGNSGSVFHVAIAFSRDGAVKMAQATASHVNKPLAILINGRVITAPILRGQISDNAVISGDFTNSEAQAIASGLNSR